MKRSKVAAFIVASLIFFAVGVSAQEKFDIVSFKAPNGWQKSVEQNAVQFTRSSGNDVAIMMLFRPIPTSKDSRASFDASWDAVVNGLLTKVETPQMQEPIAKNGWTIETGAAVGEKDGDRLAAMLISATGGGKVVNLLILTNTDAYQTDIMSFISSLDLPKVAANERTAAANDAGRVNSSLVGLWVFYNTESSGLNSNGFPMLTGGYMRREYNLKADGTYVFRAKDWMVHVKDILYVYETGKWSVSGDQLTITPTRGKGGWWSKSADGRTVGWGKFVKGSVYKLESVPYSFELHQTSDGATKLKMRSARETARDRRNSSDGNSVQEFWYESYKTHSSLIDDPPGFNTRF